MASFTRVTAVPADLPNYLFDADLEASIVVPQSYTVVPIKDGRVQLNWYKSVDTTDDGFLWTEVYRSMDLNTWDLIWVLDYPTATYFDSNVKVNQIYYYKTRFIRLNTDGIIINTSNYTVPLAAKTVTAFGVEPRDTYSNKFFKYLLQGLPGTRIYDRTDAALFSTNVESYWQTTSQMLDGFAIKANGTIVDEQAADASALYSKRNVSFFLNNRYTKLLGVEESTGVEGEQIEVHSYLIHTFLMGYAAQFLIMHENYIQVVANQFIDFSQPFTKGFKPAVSGEKTPTIATLYNSFGSLLGLNPLRASSDSQGLVRYKDTLKDSFSNIDRLGKVQAINQACSDVLGITEQTLFEYSKYPWFNADRTFKLFTVPSGSNTYFGYAAPPGADNELKITLLDERFNFFIEYIADVYASPWVDVFGSTGENPYNYVAAVHISEGVTTASQVMTRLNADTSIGHLINATPSGTPPAPITGTVSAIDRFRLTRHSPWVGWEDALFKLHGKTFKLKDVLSNVDTGTDYMTFSRILDSKDSNQNVPAGYDLLSSELYKLVGSDWVPQTGNPLSAGQLIALRDDDNEGASYNYESGGDTYDSRFIGDKHILFKMGLTTNNMTWLKSAILKLYVNQVTQAGTLRLYRIKKQYSSDGVCWNYRKNQSINGYNWNGSSYDGSTKQWVTEYWDDVGADSTDDRILLKEFPIPKMERAQWLQLDITDILQQIYKYESSRLNMGDDPQNILKCGFMITMEGMPNKSLMIVDSETGINPPEIVWSRMTNQGYYAAPEGINYYYVDGTSRYGRLLVMQSDREPVNYVKTVHEHIRNADIKSVDSTALSLTSSVPSTYAVGDKVYGLTSNAIGTITSIAGEIIYATENIKRFTTEVIRLLDDSESTTATISNINRSGAKYVRIARPRYNNSLLQVHYTGAVTTAAEYPQEYPSYEPWVEADPGIEPVFVSSVPFLLSGMHRGTNLSAGLIDTTTHFINRGVTAGMIVKNITDGSQAVITVVGTYALIAALSGGINNYWNIGDAYEVITDTTRLYYSEFDSTEYDLVWLNTTEDLSTLGDVVITYQYYYEFLPMGRTHANAMEILNIEGCQRPNSHLYSMSQSASDYHTELMLPRPSEGYFVDISGLASDISGPAMINEYSDYNLGVLCDAISNIRRFDGPVDIFKYDPIEKNYRFNQQYHQFFKKV